MTELTYAIAELFPPQGQWSDEDYLALETNKLIELSEGRMVCQPARRRTT